MPNNDYVVDNNCDYDDDDQDFNSYSIINNNNSMMTTMNNCCESGVSMEVLPAKSSIRHYFFSNVKMKEGQR